MNTYALLLIKAVLVIGWELARLVLLSLYDFPQIYLSGDDGDDHNDGANAEGSDCHLEVSRH
ncbi:hypothetical protein RM96_28120 [Cupriavidus sp. IDO]|nr:hypothetical protein RM96_28120 [Cupriavidus sp. IDO]